MAPTTSRTRAAQLERQLDAALRAGGDPERAEGARRYLKHELEHYGTDLPTLRAALRPVARQPDLDRETLIALVERLWKTPVFERRAAAAELLAERAALLQPADLPLLERLLRESGTWALVDTLAPRVVGPLVAAHPRLERTLDRWVGDADFWIQRSALLAHLVPLRRGEGDFARFAGRADRLLGEPEFFVRKAIGWVLRERSKKRPDEVYAWLLPRAARASGVTVREAVKYLPASQREAILERYRQRRRDTNPVIARSEATRRSRRRDRHGRCAPWR
jgi:3-methyladenine DNA glycosylase AlkD